MIRVIHEGSLEPILYSVEEFEKVMQIKHLPVLAFENEKVRRKVEKKCAKAAEERLYKRRQKWLGVYYEKEIAEGFSPLVTIRWVDSTIGYGLFAEQKFAPGDLIGEYTGILKYQKPFSVNPSDYKYYYSIVEGKRSRYYIDAQDQGNHCRFINHSFQGNLRPITIFSGGVMHIILIAKTAISTGDQLTYDYGEEYWKKRAPPLCI
jgi:hypothetical protein